MQTNSFRLTWKSVQAYIITTLGLLLTAAGWVLFLIPARVVGGGVTGLSTMLHFALGWSMGGIYLVINSGLLLLGLWVLGKGFGIKTVYASITLSLLLVGLEHLELPRLVTDLFLSVVLGGGLSGLGVGLAFSQGGSTGGTDVIAMIINRYRNISPGKLLLGINLVIIASSFWVLGSLERVVYSLVAMAVSAYMVDVTIEGWKRSYQVFVFSDHPERIASRISREIRRGVTLLDAQGYFSGRRSPVLTTVVRRFEAPLLVRIIREEDPAAFVSMANVMGVYGKGFEQMRP